MNRKLVLTGGALALIGLIVNVATDLDNVYDMSLAALWVLTFSLVILGVLVGRKQSGGAL